MPSLKGPESLRDFIKQSSRRYDCRFTFRKYAVADPHQWEQYFLEGKEETRAMIQAALIGLTFAILSRVSMIL